MWIQLDPGVVLGDAFHYDDELVDALRSLPTSDEKRAILVHLRGSHFKYSNRYPPSFSTVTDEQDVRAAYDASIMYTDLVLSHLLRGGSA